MRIFNLLSPVLVFALVIAVSGCSKKDDSEDETAVANHTVTIKGGTEAPAGLRLATSGIDPTVVKGKMRKVVAHLSQYCDDADGGKTIMDLSSSEASYEDFAKSPTLGSGEIPEGTYECVAIEMYDEIKFEPSETSTNSTCLQDTEYTLDVFRPQGETYRPAGVLIDGTEVTGKAEGQWMAVYMGTGSDNTGSDPDNNAFVAPSAAKPNDGMKLSAALVVSANTTVKFILDFSGKIEENGDSCDCQPPVWSFQIVD